jgi:hypothetical protein
MASRCFGEWLNISALQVKQPKTSIDEILDRRAIISTIVTANAAVDV